MDIFNSYVSLPEGNCGNPHKLGDQACNYGDAIHESIIIYLVLHVYDTVY